MINIVKMLRIFLLLFPLTLISSASLVKVDASRIVNDPQFEAALKDTFVSAFKTIYKNEWDDRFQEYMLQIFSRYLERFKSTDDMVLVVASNESALAGWALFCHEDHHAIIELICVDPKFWRQGIGRKLVFSIQDYIPAIDHLAVVTRKANAMSPYFYESLGFKRTEFKLAEYHSEEMQGFEWQQSF